MGVLLGCRHQDDAVQSRGAAAPREAQPSAVRGAPLSLSRIEAPERLVAVGDLHGDWNTASHILREVGATDTQGRWVGTNVSVVVTGDTLDRGDQDRELLDNLRRLRSEAKSAGGALHVLSGNHDVMNVAGDFRYVSPRSLASFASFAAEATPEVLLLPEPMRGRAMAFRPGGPYAKLLAEFPIVLLVGDTLFAHGGVLPKHVEYGLARLNEEVARWMRGERPLPAILRGEDVPFWVRAYGYEVSDADCQTLAASLRQVGAARLVVGHTPQKGGISFACDGKVARIDVGLSVAYGHEVPAVLEIRKDGVRAVTLARLEGP